MEINKDLTRAEIGFNIAGSIPVVAIISGSLRVAAAKIQMLVGGLIALVGLVGQMIHNGSLKMEELTKTGVTQMKHGFLNSLRGVGEFMAGLTIIGSFGFLIGQLSSKNKFTPIVKYDE